MKDDCMDFEANIDKKQEGEKVFKEEIVTLKEKLKGKDDAIGALGKNLMTKALE